MKVLVNRRIVEGPWGGGNNFIRALVQGLQNAGHEVTNKLEPGIDCFFIADPRPNSDCIGLADFMRVRDEFPNVKLIQRINECDARKNTEHMDNFLLQCSSVIDTTNFVSDWLASYFSKRGWRCSRNMSIHNGVDTNVFKPSKKSPNAEVPSVVAHHWSNNIMKGFDVYDFLDYMASKKMINFTYIGRHRNSFNNTVCVDPCTGAVLADKLSGHDIYISGSRFDPGPNHILESISVGLPTYVHADGGGAVEFAGSSHSFRNFSQLEKLILDRNYSSNDYQPQAWEECIDKYLIEIENL